MLPWEPVECFLEIILWLWLPRAIFPGLSGGRARAARAHAGISQKYLQAADSFPTASLGAVSQESRQTP